MTKANKQAQEIADLKREVAELKAKVSPPESKFKPMSDAEWIDHVHQMRERNASVIPPWLREACAGGVTEADCADIVRASHRPTGRPGKIPEEGQTSGRPGGNVPGSGTGWASETPLGPPPGIRYVDQQLDAQDARDRAERVEQEARLQAMEKLAEQTETMRQQTETLAKLAEQKSSAIPLTATTNAAATRKSPRPTRRRRAPRQSSIIGGNRNATSRTRTTTPIWSAAFRSNGARRPRSPNLAEIATSRSANYWFLISNLTASGSRKGGAIVRDDKDKYPTGDKLTYEEHLALAGGG
jgi:hypothetical protein